MDDLMLYKLEFDIIDILGREMKGKPPFAEMAIEVKKRFKLLYSELEIDTSDKPVQVNVDFGECVIQFDFGSAKDS